MSENRKNAAYVCYLMIFMICIMIFLYGLAAYKHKHNAGERAQETIEIVETTCTTPAITPLATATPTPQPKSWMETDFVNMDERAAIILRTDPADYPDLLMDIHAYMVGLSVEEFELFARVVEAESDRSQNVEGRVYISATIWNRMFDSRFPNSITGVLTQPNQFSTVRGGHCSTTYTQLSSWAIVQALKMLESGEIPDNILYFNCIGYNGFTPYDCIGGNFFMTD